MRRTSVRALGALTAAFTLAGLATAMPASAETGPDLRVTATVQGGHWLPNDQIPIDVTITNVGDVKAEGVKGQVWMYAGPYFSIWPNAWGDLYDRGAGASFAPGETRTYRVHGTVGTLDQGDPVFRVRVIGTADADESDNAPEVTAGLVPAGTTDRVAGHLYGDADHDGRPSHGEDLAGVEIRLRSGGPGVTERVTTTDDTGRFTFDGVPVDRYYSVYFESFPSGWVNPSFGPLRVDGTGQHTALEIRAGRPLTDSLQASARLDKASYAVGETATGTVTITNVSDRRLTNLWVGCDPVGAGTHLVMPPGQWGDFDPAKQAGVLTPGQRVELTASGKVTDKSSYTGQAHLTCYIAAGNDTSGPVAETASKVPGKRVDDRGQVWTDKNGNARVDTGEGVPNLTVALVTKDNRLVSLARTDTNGFATFPQVGVGTYRLRVAGAWKSIGDTETYVIAPPYRLGDWSHQVAPR
ncbi:SdrD B-like domain-containing protein [Amycolatopsis orientalis]|uniref:SdrD B-like domain-containing protein n=1 Tax=Amycolatopsis orientalis TaxID=31958 RepID=UPI000401FB5D|nr:SdrD B-like domain-containing protein [Amycolatopsis orientalis]